jgi:hypothetical protein
MQKDSTLEKDTHMALIPIEERVEPTEPVMPVPGYGGLDRELAYPVNLIVEEIQEAASAEGFQDPNLFKIFSGYRSDERQLALYNKRVNQLLERNPGMELAEAQKLARKTVAPPGNSSHRTGYAFDIYLGHHPSYSIDSSQSENVAHIESTPAYDYMTRIAKTYGLTQLPNEPWHWECDSNCRENYLENSQVTESAQSKNYKWIAITAVSIALGFAATYALRQK